MKKKFSLKIISIYLLSSLLFFYLDELVFDNIFNAYTNFFFDLHIHSFYHNSHL